jgi:hypothetical protein
VSKPPQLPRAVLIAIEAMWTAANKLVEPFCGPPVTSVDDEGNTIIEYCGGAYHEIVPAQTAAAAPSTLVDVDEAAMILGISPSALRMRITRGQVPGVVRTGRRVQVHRERLTKSLERKARR